MAYESDNTNPEPAQSGFDELIRMEYEYLTRQFMSNEEMGEKRVGLLVTLTAGIGAALLLANGSDSPGLPVPASLLFIVITVLWLFVAYLTFLRIVHRNVVTDRLKIQLRRLRSSLVAEGDSRRQYLPYDPYGPKPGLHSGLSLVSGNGGYAELTAFVVSVTTGALAWQIDALAGLGATRDGPNDPGALISAAIAILVAVGVWYALAALARRKYAKVGKRIEEGV